MRSFSLLFCRAERTVLFCGGKLHEQCWLLSFVHLEQPGEDGVSVGHKLVLVLPRSLLS